MITLKTPPKGRVPIDLTPLIDIVFIVIVFLLLCMNSPVIELPFDLPEDNNQSIENTQTPSEIHIQLRASPPYYAMEGVAYEDFKAFKDALIFNLANREKINGVAIASDAETPVEPLLNVLGLLNKHSITNTHILMEKK